MELTVEGLRFRYPQSTFALGVDAFRVRSGERLALVGPSGCGKSTLLKLLSGILVPSAGTIHADGQPLSGLRDSERRAFRARQLGYVFQDFGLLDYLTVRENLLLPGRLNPALALDTALQSRAAALAARTGLGPLLDRPVTRLSQGERQRVALCRALVGEPRLIFADEPTGNLDPANKESIFDLLLAHAGDIRATLIVVTHDHSFLDRFDRTVALGDLVRTSAV